MDLLRFLRNIDLNEAPPRAPGVLLYVPPSGRAVHCADLEAAKVAAINYAAEHPGITVAIYQIAGFAHKPIEKPVFQETEAALAALLPSEPDSGITTTAVDDNRSELESFILDESPSPQETDGSQQ